MTAQELWQRNRDLRDACLKHPFGGEPAPLAELYRPATQLELASFQTGWEAA